MSPLWQLNRVQASVLNENSTCFIWDNLAHFLMCPVGLKFGVCWHFNPLCMCWIFRIILPQYVVCFSLPCVELAVSLTLFLQKVVPGDAGTYYCVATNKVGNEQCMAVDIVTSKKIDCVFFKFICVFFFKLYLLGLLIHGSQH